MPKSVFETIRNYKNLSYRFTKFSTITITSMCTG